MQLNAIVTRSSGIITLPGGSPFSAALLLRDTLELSLTFVDDSGRVIELPGDAVGHLVLKLASAFTSASRVQANSWQALGSGANRRYRFTVMIWSGLLQDDLVANPDAAYALQMEYVIDGKPYQIQTVPAIVSPTYIAPGDVPPPVPTVAHRRPWAREIYGPTEDVDDATRYVGHIDKGGALKSIRISVPTYHPGLTVQLKHNGTNLFTAPIEIVGQTTLITDGDDPLLFARLTVSDGARIEAVTQFNELEYASKPKGLQVEFTILTDEVSQLDHESEAAYDWLKTRIPGLDWDDETQEGSVPAAPGSDVTFDIVGGALIATKDGSSIEIPGFPYTPP